MGILVTGSVAFDHIMDFPGFFKDHILPEKVHVLSVSFLVETLRRQHGGAAANIAYNLTLLEERPAILASVGEDFDDYRRFLEARGIDTSAVECVEGELTASAFITTDRDDNQITGFYPGAMRAAGRLSVGRAAGDSTPELVVISPDAPEAMARYPQECRDLGIPYIYSPGQQIVALSPEQLLDGIRGAACVIGNDYEMEMIASKTGSSPDDLLEMAGMVVTTLGDQGSRIALPAGTADIPVAPPRHVVDPTGAGDAYVAGVALGLRRGLTPEQFGRVGALCATYAVEQYGTQQHEFSVDSFRARYREAFGTEPP